MTKQQLINQFKADYPSLTKQINDDVITLDQDEYEATIDAWADARLARAEKKAKIEADAIAKAALLAQLGITEEQAKLLLS